LPRRGAANYCVAEAVVDSGLQLMAWLPRRPPGCTCGATSSSTPGESAVERLESVTALRALPLFARRDAKAAREFATTRGGAMSTRMSDELPSQKPPGTGYGSQHFRDDWDYAGTAMRANRGMSAALCRILSSASGQLVARARDLSAHEATTDLQLAVIFAQSACDLHTEQALNDLMGRRTPLLNEAVLSLCGNTMSLADSRTLCPCPPGAQECKPLQSVSSRRDDAGRNRRHADGIGAIKLEARPRYHFTPRGEAPSSCGYSRILPPLPLSYLFVFPAARTCELW